ncbi:MAG: thiol peroxidase [Candidatus Omnitrophica bacterium]|nr:thiol peroxidase [Candidatus Omnitrophota bacterium]
MARTVMFQGNALTLVGRIAKVGMRASDFKVVSQEMRDVSLSDFKGRIKVISSFPSLDTPVCDLQVKEFNKRASAFSQDVVVIGISKDLPFAQKRFCSEHNINNEPVLSDYKTSSFGINYGMLIKELNLLARSVRIIDKNDIVRYIQLAPEITKPLNYDDAVTALDEVMKNPASAVKEELPSKCKPCEGIAAPIPKAEIEKLAARNPSWEVIEGKKIVKEFKFKDFPEAKYFLDTISVIAEEQGHHPTLTLMYNKLKITLTTRAAGGLTENDFIMAGIIDGML